MGKYLRKQRKRLSARRMTHSAILKNLPTGSNPEGYRAPGSMRRKKGKW